ncbi:MAG: NUDIX domain-containing protein [Nocardioides sp.]|nr:NUDIX domain-containing protein [Nocardioides sp.]
MPTPDFIIRLREKVGHDQLWLAGATAVVLNNDDVLLVKRSDNGKWSPVTGIVDPGEHPAATAVREVAEETGIDCAVEELVWVNVTPPTVHVNGDRAQYLDHTFRCRYLCGEPYPADEESSEVAWFPADSLPPMDPSLAERITTARDHDRSCRLD